MSESPISGDALTQDDWPGTVLADTATTSAPTYVTYVLECSPDWELPNFYEPKLRLPRRNTRTTFHHLSDLPRRITKKKYFQKAIVYDASVPAKQRDDSDVVEAWRFLAKAAETVYYVGHSENFEHRKQCHENGSAATFTEDATIKTVHKTVEHEQDLRDEVHTALGKDIVSKREYIQQWGDTFGSKQAMEKTLEEMEAACDRIVTQPSISLRDAVELVNETPASLDNVQSVIGDARAARRASEQEQARDLRQSSTHTVEVEQFGSTREKERLNINDIETFVYWN